MSVVQPQILLRSSFDGKYFLQILECDIKSILHGGDGCQEGIKFNRFEYLQIAGFVMSLVDVILRNINTIYI